MKLPLIAYIDIFSNLFPLAAGGAVWKRVTNELVIVFIFVAIGALTELLTLYMAFQHLNNLWVLHIYILVEYVLLALIFSKSQPDQRLRRIISASIPVFAVFWLVSKWTIESWTGPAPYTHTLSAAIFTILSTTALVQLIRSEQAVPLLGNTHFWIFVALLIYFTGNVTLFLLIDTFTQFQFLNAVNVWTLHWVLSIVVNLSFMMSFLCLRRR